MKVKRPLVTVEVLYATKPEEGGPLLCLREERRRKDKRREDKTREEEE